jgi:transcription elongation factor Elf1
MILFPNRIALFLLPTKTHPMIEHFFQCPHCFEEISMLVDPSVRRQEYIEDCEVCCNPIEIQVEMEEGEIMYFEANSIEQ